MTALVVALLSWGCITAFTLMGLAGQLMPC